MNDTALSRTCGFCGNEYTPKPNNAARQRTCGSKRCIQLKDAGGKAGWGVSKACEACGKTWKTRWADRRACSRWCGVYVRAGKWPQSSVPAGHPVRSSLVPDDHPARQGHGVCAYCVEPFVSVSGRVQNFCTRRCKDRAKGRRRDAQKRAGRPLDPSERIVPLRVFERDGWRCQVCRRLVKRGAVVPHPRAPTVDHVIPLSPRGGGGRDDMANARTAHYECNSKRGDRGGYEQLALIG